MAKTQHGRDLTGEEMAQMLDEFCNAGGRDKAEAFVQTLTKRTHRTLQQSVMGLFIKSIEEWARDGDAGRFDLRNEGTVKLAQKIVEKTGDKYDRMLPYV